MATCFGKSCSFGLLCVSFENVYEFVCVLLSLLVLRVMWDLIVLIPEHCLSIYFSLATIIYDYLMLRLSEFKEVTLQAFQFKIDNKTLLLHVSTFFGK